MRPPCEEIGEDGEVEVNCPAQQPKSLGTSSLSGPVATTSWCGAKGQPTGGGAKVTRSQLRSLSVLKRAIDFVGMPLHPGQLVAASLLLLANAANAQDALLDSASALMRQRDAAGAYAQLVAHEAERAGDSRFDYLLGVAALDSGHVTRAIFALQRAVAVRPDDALARAELARAYLAAGESASARDELERVRGAQLPEGVAATIDRVLGIIDQVAPPWGPKISGYLEFGAGYDSNVNSATNQGEFAIPAFGGLLFTAGPESRRQHDEFGELAGGVSAQLAIDPAWKLVVAANARGMENRRVHQMNTDLVDATVALSHTAGENVQTVALQSATAWVGSSVYRTANGASAQWQTQINAVSQASAFAQWSRQEYVGQVERNTDRAVLGLGAARNFAAIDTLIYGSAYLADERVRHDEFSFRGHHAAGLRVGAERPLGANGVLFLEWQHERRNYGGSEPLFDVGRQDRQDDLTAGLRFAPAAWPHWQVVPQIRYTRAASNVVLYDYTRTIFQITLRREFP